MFRWMMEEDGGRFFLGVNGLQIVMAELRRGRL